MFFVSLTERDKTNYARILRTMYFDRPDADAPLPIGPLARFTLVLLMALVLLLGLAWAPLGWLIQWAVRMGLASQ